MAKKAASWKEYNQAAILEMVIAALPEIARAVSEPLSKTGSVTIVSTGGEGLGASKLTGDVTKIVAELPAVLEALTGVDFKVLMANVPALKEAMKKSGQTDAGA